MNNIQSATTLYLKTVWSLWKRLAQTIGDFIGRIVLTVFYFTILVPFGLGVRLLSDPLELKDFPKAGWLDRETHDTSLEHGRRLA